MLSLEYISKSIDLIDILEYLVVIIYVGIFVMSILLSIKKLYTLANPLGRLEIFGKGIRNALEKTKSAGFFE